MVAMMAAKNAGLDNAEPRTPENTTPTSFRHWSEKILKPALGLARHNARQEPFDLSAGGV
jgi:hypothetical protein